MFSQRRFLTLIIILLLSSILALTACQNAPTGTGPTSPPPTISASPPTLPSPVGVATVAVQGRQVTILTTPQGFTLYYFTADTATTAACTGPCTGKWPPVLYSAKTQSLTGPHGQQLPGTLGVSHNANGEQLTYNGHPLYRYAGDMTPGQAQGEGFGGKWFVATLTLTQ